jgi:hypothetical protein
VYEESLSTDEKIGLVCKGFIKVFSIKTVV